MVPSKMRPNTGIMLLRTIKSYILSQRSFARASSKDSSMADANVSNGKRVLQDLQYKYTLSQVFLKFKLLLHLGQKTVNWSIF